jgi:hypothetical protein
MTGHAVLIATVTAILGVTGVTTHAGRQAAPQDRQVFRASTDEVTVDVSVRSGSDRVGGLSAKDFVLTDNGVPQQIDRVDSSAVPVDVSVLVDTNREVDDETDDIVSQATRVARMVRPTDRLRVWNVSTVVSEIQPIALAGGTPTVPPMTGGGLDAIYDGLAAALMEPVAPDGRHLVIAISNGVDTDSVLSLPTVRAIAERSNATLHVSQIDVTEEPPSEAGAMWVTAREWMRGNWCHEGNCESGAAFWQPHYTPVGANRFDPLADVAKATNGKLHTLGLFIEHNAADVFSNAFKDFQQNYLLRYRPQGVTRLGWHTIDVKIPGYPDYTVHARRGYAIEDAVTPAATAPPTAATGTSPASPIDPILRDYERHDYDATLTSAAGMDPLTMVSSLRAAGDLWPATPRREAVLALELARIALMKGLDRARKPVVEWLADENRFVRGPVLPDEFEHAWLLAEVDLLEAPLAPGEAERVVTAGLERFPNDPRLLLDLAIAADQRWTFGSPAVLPRSQLAGQVSNVLGRYDAVLAHTEAPDLVAEARVRSAWMEHRAGNDAAALSRLDEVHEADADVVVRYLRQLFRGHVLMSLKRPADAVTAYRAAVEFLPGGEAARVGLMNGLLAAGDRAGALALSEQVQTATPTVVDPWHFYWEGNYRHFPDAIAALRALVR